MQVHRPEINLISKNAFFNNGCKSGAFERLNSTVVYSGTISWSVWKRKTFTVYQRALYVFNIMVKLVKDSESLTG